MTVFKYKRLGKLSLNRDLPAEATHYRDDTGAEQRIAVAKPGELLFYYLVGDHKDLHLGRIGMLKLPEPMPLDLDRHLGGELPGPQGKGMTKAMAAAVLADVQQTFPELADRLARYFAKV